jgi:hypothetical protein
VHSLYHLEQRARELLADRPALQRLIDAYMQDGIPYKVKLDRLQTLIEQAKDTVAIAELERQVPALLTLFGRSANAGRERQGK